jgi:hypothetical protein
MTLIIPHEFKTLLMMKRRRNEIPILVIVFFLIALGQSACNGVSKEQQQEQAKIESRIQPLAINGKHGYFVATYLVGRMKSTLIDENPFDMEVKKINPELLEKSIRIKVIDSTGYELIYKNDNKETRLKGYFKRPLKTNQVELLISRRDYGKEKNELLLEAQKNEIVEFKIVKY